MWTNTRKTTMSATKQINSLAEVKCLAVATAGKRETRVGNGQERKNCFFVFLFVFFKKIRSLLVQFVLLFSLN